MRAACVLMPLLLLIGLELMRFSFHRPLPMAMLAVMLQIGIGVAAALLLDRAFGRRAILAALGLAAVLLVTARAVPRGYEWAADVLMWAPFMMILMLGAITAIPPDVFEAAAVDRADAWFVLGNVTMPLVAPLLLHGIVFRVLETLNERRPLSYVLFAHGVLLAGIGIGEFAVRQRQRRRRRETPR